MKLAITGTLALAGLAALGSGCAVDCDAPGNVCSVAGTGEYGHNAETVAKEASLYKPMDVTALPDGGFVIADWNNHQFRHVDSEGAIDCWVGTDFLGDGDPDFNERIAPGVPGTEVALNHNTSAEWNPVTERLMIASWHNHRLREYDPATGLSQVVCADTALDDGNGANAGFAGDGGPCSEALMAFPNSIVVRPDGDFYFWAQKNRRVRKVTGDYQLIETIAGSGEQGYAGDGGPLLEASFNDWDPADLQPEPSGAIELVGDVIYLADSGNHAIRVLDLANDTVSTLPGTGLLEPGTWTPDATNCDPTTLCSPRDVEMGPDGRLYIADTYNHVVRAYDLETETMEVVAGVLGVKADGADGVPATESELNEPYGIDFADDGALLIADTYNSRIRRVAP